MTVALEGRGGHRMPPSPGTLRPIVLSQPPSPAVGAKTAAPILSTSGVRKDARRGSTHLRHRPSPTHSNSSTASGASSPLNLLPETTLGGASVREAGSTADSSTIYQPAARRKAAEGTRSVLLRNYHGAAHPSSSPVDEASSSETASALAGMATPCRVCGELPCACLRSRTSSASARHQQRPAATSSVADRNRRRTKSRSSSRRRKGGSTGNKRRSAFRDDFALAPVAGLQRERCAALKAVPGEATFSTSHSTTIYRRGNGPLSNSDPASYCDQRDAAEEGPSTEASSSSSDYDELMTFDEDDFLHDKEYFFVARAGQRRRAGGGAHRGSASEENDEELLCGLSPDDGGVFLPSDLNRIADLAAAPSQRGVRAIPTVTPQVLAAISVAANSIANGARGAARRARRLLHPANCIGVSSVCRDGGAEEGGEANSSTAAAAAALLAREGEEVQQRESNNPLRRWSRIPIGAFRSLRVPPVSNHYIPKNVLKPSALVDAASITLLSGADMACGGGGGGDTDGYGGESEEGVVCAAHHPPQQRPSSLHYHSHNHNHSRCSSTPTITPYDIIPTPSYAVRSDTRDINNNDDNINNNNSNVLLDGSDDTAMREGSSASAELPFPAPPPSLHHSANDDGADCRPLSPMAIDTFTPLFPECFCAHSRLALLMDEVAGGDEVDIVFHNPFRTTDPPPALEA